MSTISGTRPAFGSASPGDDRQVPRRLRGDRGPATEAGDVVWKTHVVSWYRDSEDDDGTRHYTVEDRWGRRRKVTLTREQRRRMNRVSGTYTCAVLLLGILGWVIGRAHGNGLVGVVVGLGAGVLALSVLALLGGAVSGIVGYFRPPRE